MVSVMHRLLHSASRVLAASLLGLALVSPATRDVAAGNVASGVITGVNVQLRDAAAAATLNRSLTDASFWPDDGKSAFKGKKYDEIRLKSQERGYLLMVTGEGGRDFDQAVVAEAVFLYQWQLPSYMAGAKAAVWLGNGIDPQLGLPHTDTFFFLDFDIFYGTLVQRMYRLDLDDGRIVLAFERLDPSYVDADTWAKYQQQIETTSGGVDRRWPPFNKVVPVNEVFGMFIVEPGESLRSRVTLVNKLGFSTDGAGWVAQMGAEMPLVIRSGLKSGFDASVAIAAHVQEARDAAKQ